MHLIFKHSSIKLQPCVLDQLILAVFDPALNGPKRGFDYLANNSILFLVTNASTWDI